MGELVDSSAANSYTVASYRQKAVDFVNAFGSQIDLWEVGNEVNGEWVGQTSQDGGEDRRRLSRWSPAGGRTALTLYYDPNCWEKTANEMFTWAQANIPAAMKAGSDYVFISYYPEDCNNYWPSQSGWQSVFDQLHQMFPTPSSASARAATAKTATASLRRSRCSTATTSFRSRATTTWAATSGGTTSRTPCPTRATGSGTRLGRQHGRQIGLAPDPNT